MLFKINLRDTNKERPSKGGKSRRRICAHGSVAL